jgi:glycerol-3-phosphate dehydrogenase
MDLPQKNRSPLSGRVFHIVVIGGGINGVAIARECARAGRRVLLLEQNDFAAGTTSRSTRIIHGGLRYLEHGEVSLVRESLRERQRLLHERPHLVHTTEFLLALGKNSRRSAMQVRLGLWLYRRLGGHSGGQQKLGIDSFERLLDSGQSWSIFNFEDAQCEFPERLVAEWLVEAAEAGAVVRNHTQVLAVDVVHGRAKGVLLRDLLSGNDERVDAGWIVNASGPWVDRVCQRSSIKTAHPLLGGVRGSHIVLPAFRGIPEAAIFAEAVDGRPIFVIPWNGQVMVGTTEVADTGDPGKSQPSSDEVNYLVQSLRKIFPQVPAATDTIHYAFAGVRPLPYAKEKDLSAITRRHLLHDHSQEGVQRLISIIGGKLTTAAELARQCARTMGIDVREPRGITAVLGGGRATLDDFIAEVAAAAGISADGAESIAEWYGPKSLEVAQFARRGAAMRLALCPHTQHIVAEAAHAYQNEYAITLGDVLLRRVPVALGPCWSEECSRTAAGRIAAALEWPETQMKSELQSFESERSSFMTKPRS